MKKTLILTLSFLIVLSSMLYVFSQESSTATINIVASPPTITGHTITPKAAVNGSSVNLRLSATDIQGLDKKYARITSPNGSKETVTIPTNYTARKIGRYNVTFFANNTEGLVSNTTDYFVSAKGVRINIGVIDANESQVNANITIIYNDETLYLKNCQTNFCNVTLPNVTVDIGFRAYDAYVVLKGVSLTETDKVFGLDKLGTPLGDQKVTYGINNTFEIESGVVKLFYENLDITNEDGLSIVKCIYWDFVKQRCDVTFTAVDVTQNLSEKSLTVETNDFSGFGIRETTVVVNQVVSGGGGHRRESIYYINNTIFQPVPYPTQEQVKPTGEKKDILTNIITTIADNKELLLLIEITLIMILVILAFLTGFLVFGKKRKGKHHRRRKEVKVINEGT